MANVNKPNTFTANTTASASDVNENFDTIYNEFNGNISAANLATDAVTTAKITDSNVTTAKIADSNVTTAKIADNAVTSEKLVAALTNASPGSLGDIGTSYGTLASLSVPAGTWFILGKGNGAMSVAQQSDITAEIYNSTDTAILDTTVTSADYVSGTDQSRPAFTVATIVTLAGTKTITLRCKVSDSAGTTNITNGVLIAISVGV